MDEFRGRIVGPYRFLAPLGEGGMAVVYRAEHRDSGETVAIKLLARQFAADPEFVARFQREAKILAGLHHAHILPILDVGEADGLVYYAMPLVTAGTVAGLLHGGGLPTWQVVQIVSQVGGALEYAHARGIIHRDVKPSNILVGHDGGFLLADFGIAKMLEATTRLTQTGGVIGTPHYMSPEQGRGEALDGRSDIYSLGVVMYELCTGRVPFRADTPMGVLYMHNTASPPSPRSLNPQCPPAAERVILKALAKRRRDRYATAGDMLRALATLTPAPRVHPPPKPKVSLPSARILGPAYVLTLRQATVRLGQALARRDLRRVVALAVIGLALVIFGSVGAVIINQASRLARPPTPSPLSSPAAAFAANSSPPGSTNVPTQAVVTLTSLSTPGDAVGLTAISRTATAIHLATEAASNNAQTSVAAGLATTYMGASATALATLLLVPTRNVTPAAQVVVTALLQATATPTPRPTALLNSNPSSTAKVQQALVTQSATPLTTPTQQAPSANDVTLVPTAAANGSRVLGQVTYAQAAVNTARVTLHLGTGTFGTAVTGPDGNYAFDGVGAGQYWIEASAPIPGLEGEATNLRTDSRAVFGVSPSENRRLDVTLIYQGASFQILQPPDGGAFQSPLVIRWTKFPIAVSYNLAMYRLDGDQQIGVTFQQFTDGTTTLDFGKRSDEPPTKAGQCFLFTLSGHDDRTGVEVAFATSRACRA